MCICSIPGFVALYTILALGSCGSGNRRVLPENRVMAGFRWFASRGLPLSSRVRSLGFRLLDQIFTYAVLHLLRRLAPRMGCEQ